MTKQLHSPVEIVLIDDKEDFRADFTLDAAKRRLIVKGFSNLESALEYLEESKKTLFVVLDAKCFIHEGQKIGTEDINFLMTAPYKIREIAEAQNRTIPFCVYTGYSENVGTLEGVCKVFEKGNQSENLFNHIIETVSNYEEYSIRHEYKMIISGLENAHFTEEYIEEFINACLRNKQLKNNPSKSIIRDFRPLLEGIYIHFNETFPGVLDEKFFLRNLVNLNGITKRLGGNRRFNGPDSEYTYDTLRIMPNHIFEVADFFKNSTSEIAMHYYDENVEKNFVKILFHSLLEIIDWYLYYYKTNK